MTAATRFGRALRRLAVVVASFATLTASAQADVEQLDAPLAFAQKMRQAVVSIRTLVGTNTQPVSTGSGFIIGADGRVVTNHHVVGLVLRKPSQYQLQVKLPSGTMTTAVVVAFSLEDDLAVLQLATPLPAQLASIRLPKLLSTPADGTTIYSFGDASGMGVVSTRGHFSGLLAKTGFERYHFTGTLNPGMSGGPAVDKGGALIGVNSSRKTDAEQMSFLVPVARVQAILERSASSTPFSAASAVVEIGRQLVEFQGKLASAALGTDQASTRYGPYLAPDFGPGRLRCGPINSGTEDDEDEPRPVAIQGVSCRMLRGLELGDGLDVGHFAYSHRHFQARSLNAARFNSLMDSVHRESFGETASKAMAAPQCIDRFTLAGRKGKLPVRLTLCAQAYREFEGVYDVNLSLVTRDRPAEALVSKLQLVGITWPQAMAYARRLVEGIQ